YLDMEGVPDEGFVYLIGMVVAQGDTEERYSFWADTKDQEMEICEQFLAVVGRYQDFLVFSYGSYERTFFKRMRKEAVRKDAVDRVLDRLVNVLSLVYAHFYFPLLLERVEGRGGMPGLLLDRATCFRHSKPRLESELGNDTG